MINKRIVGLILAANLFIFSVSLSSYFSNLLAAEIELPDKSGKFTKIMRYDIDRDAEIEDILLRKEGDSAYSIIFKEDKRAISEKVVIDCPPYSEPVLLKIEDKFNVFMGIGYGCSEDVYRLILFKYSEADDAYKVEESARFFSNVPAIEIEDVDNDGINEIICYRRHFTIRPIKNISKRVYGYSSDKGWRLISWKRVPE